MLGRSPDDFLHSLSALKPSEAKRQFRKSIFAHYPLRGPFGQPACAYCGQWHEKLTLDHIVPKSKGGPHFSKWNLVPACSAHNLAKNDFPVFEWWRPQDFWTEERELILTMWVHVNSFISAHTDLGLIESQRKQWPVDGSIHKDVLFLQQMKKAPEWAPLFSESYI